MANITCKTILTKTKLSKAHYVLNPYFGCTHACVYCYAEWMNHTRLGEKTWGKFVDVKENAMDLLQKEKHKIKPGQEVFMASITDVYQPIEKSCQLTRQALRILLEQQAAVSILTKSDLVVRDMDILRQMKQVEVGMSINCIDQEIVSVLEPGTISIQRRIEALKTLKEANISTYVMMSPLIPYCSKLEPIFKQITPYVDYVLGEILNLKVTNMEKWEQAMWKVVGKEKTEKIKYLCGQSSYLYGAKNEFERLCEKYHVKNGGFFLHNQKIINK